MVRFVYGLRCYRISESCPQARGERLAPPGPKGDFVALLSYLPLKSYWSVPPFFLYTAQVVKQLA